MLKKAQKKLYTQYVLTAINAIKQHISRNGDLLNHLNTPTPNRNCVVKAFKELYGAGIAQYKARQHPASKGAY